MKKIKLSTNFAIFILFFGLSLIEAFQNKDWAKATLFILLGFLFVRADNKK